MAQSLQERLGKSNTTAGKLSEALGYIAELEARLARLEQAARPFADLLSALDEQRPDEMSVKCYVQIGHLRDLAAALDEKQVTK